MIHSSIGSEHGDSPDPPGGAAEPAETPEQPEGSALQTDAPPAAPDVEPDSETECAHALATSAY